MLERIAPRCDRDYTFYESGSEFTLRPLTVNGEGEIVFRNLCTREKICYPTSKFIDLYKNNLTYETTTIPKFFKDKNFKQSEKFYAVAKGRVDFFITNKEYYMKPVIRNYQGAVYKEFEYFSDAYDFINDENNLPNEESYLIETGLTTDERLLIEAFRNFPDEHKKPLIQELLFKKNLVDILLTQLRPDEKELLSDFNKLSFFAMDSIMAQCKTLAEKEKSKQKV